MPLIPTVFSTELDTLAPTIDVDVARQRHAQAFRRYMEGLVTVPVLLPAYHDAAEGAMTAALVGQHLAPPTGINAINAGYLAYVSALIAALAASGWVVSVPPLPPGPILAPLPVGYGTSAYALLVHTWVTKISGSVPPTVPSLWT